MTFRTIALIAASFTIGIASIAMTSTQSAARTPAGTTRLHHHHHHRTPGIHHSGQAHRTPAKPPATSAPRT